MASENQLIDFGTKEVFGFVVNTNTIYMSWITMVIVAGILFAATRNPKLVPGKLQLCVEAVFEFVGGLVRDNLGERGAKMVGPFFLTLFLYILIGNELGLLPQVLEPWHIHITSPTNDINTTLGLGLTVAITINVLGVVVNGPGFFKHLCQPSVIMLPLHLIDEVLRPFVLAFRLFGNIIAGEVMLIVLYQLAPWVLPEIWVGFSLAIGLIQAVIFTILGICYMRGVFAHSH